MMNVRIPNVWRAAAAMLAALVLQGCIPTLIVGGAATGALVATDRREPEVIAGDARVELTAHSRIDQRYGDKVHVDITSYNYDVLLTGEVPSARVKSTIGTMVLQIPKVKGIVNALQVAGLSSLASRGNDTYLTGKIKAEFVTEDKFQPNHVKVVTEAGVVYLLGLVTHKEADEATEIARSTNGVRKVVRVFEYLTPGKK